MSYKRNSYQQYREDGKWYFSFNLAGKKKLINFILHVTLIYSALSDEFNSFSLFGRQFLYICSIILRTIIQSLEKPFTVKKSK